MPHTSDSRGLQAHSPRGPGLADIVPGLGLPLAPSCAVDVGCGAGDDVRWLHGAGFQAIGIDASSDALRVASTRTPSDMKISWLQGSATSLPLSDQSCVLVIDRGCLHHLPPDQRGRYAEEVERVLAAGGAWVIRDVIGHQHQVAELSADAIGELARSTSLRVEVCDIIEGLDSHTWLLAVLRRD